MKIKDVCDLINGRAFKPDDWNSYGVPIVRIQNLNDENAPFNYYTGEYSKAHEVNDGELLFSWSGTPGTSFGAFLWNRGKGVLNQHIFKVVPKVDVNKEYLKYALNGNLVTIISKAHGGVGLQHITKKELDEIDIQVPSMDTQSAIIAILRSVEGIIWKRKLQLQKLDELIKARFVEMFGDPETNPMGWEQVTLGDVCSSIVRGPFGSALKKEFFVDPDATTYKVYEQKHAIQKSATIGTYYITAEKFNELMRFECVSGDILMSCSGTMGELYQLPEGCERGIINQALCKFTLNERILPVCFLVYMRQTIGNLETKGSGIQNIAAVSYVKAMPINLPPMEVQEAFATFVSQGDKTKLSIKASLDQLETLKQSLMQKYFGD